MHTTNREPTFTGGVDCVHFLTVEDQVVDVAVYIVTCRTPNIAISTHEVAPTI